VAEQSMQIRRDLLQRKIIVFMAMRAAHIVEMLPLRLLGSERDLRMTPGGKRDDSGSKRQLNGETLAESKKSAE
jgi:hypothetical protein